MRKALTAAVPSAVNPDIAIPTLSSILKSFFCEDDSSDAARFKVASTTNSSFCKGARRGNYAQIWKVSERVAATGKIDRRLSSVGY